MSPTKRCMIDSGAWTFSTKKSQPLDGSGLRSVKQASVVAPAETRVDSTVPFHASLPLPAASTLRVPLAGVAAPAGPAIRATTSAAGPTAPPEVRPLPFPCLPPGEFCHTGALTHGRSRAAAPTLGYGPPA